MIVIPRSVRLCAAIAFGLSLIPCLAATPVEFSDQTDLKRHFIVRTLGDPAHEAYVWSAQPGAGGAAGRLDVQPVAANSYPTLFSTQAFDLNQSALTASFLFQSSAQGAGFVPRIALLLHTQQEAVNPASLNLKSVWMEDGTGRAPARLITGGAAAVAEQGELAALSTGHWYGLSTTWTLAEDGASVEVSSELWGYGADGTHRTGLVASASVRITDPSLFGNGGVVSPLYLGILAQNGPGGAGAIDQISIEGAVPVPEPALAAAALALMLGLGGIARRRVRSCCD